MKKLNTALGFYQNFKTAASVLKKLKDAGIKRTVLIQKVEGRLIIQSPFPLKLWFTLSLLLLAILIIFLSIFDFSLYLNILFLAATLVFTFLFFLQAYFYAINKKTINKFKNLILDHEVLVLAKIHPRDERRALEILRHVESGHPLSFLLRPERLPAFDKEQIIKEPLPLEQLNQRAINLAESLLHTHHVTSNGKTTLLKCLNDSERIINEIQYNVAGSEYLEQTITSSAEWLLDNIYVIKGNIEEIRTNLPKKFYRELPKIAEGKYKDLPRIYVIAKDLVECTANRLNHDNIIAYLSSFQKIIPLTIGELWAMSLMLKFRIIECIQYLATHIDRRLREGENASFWGNRLLTVSRREPERLQDFLSLLAQEENDPSPHFAEELLDHLYDEEAALPPLKAWIEAKLQATVPNIIHAEQLDKSVEQVSFSNAVISLITMSQLSWQLIFESLSVVDNILNQDPASVYLNMDFTSRNYYREKIEILSRNSPASELEVARNVLQLSQNGTEEISRHVGYYLIDAGRAKVEKAINYKPTLVEKIRHFLRLHPAAIYLSSIAATTGLIVFGLYELTALSQYSTTQNIIAILLSIIVASEFSIQLINFILSRFVHPYALPKFSFEHGVPLEYKTLVIIPAMLSSIDIINENINRLEIHYLANKEETLTFGLFFDFVDAAEAHIEEDNILLEAAEKGIKNLNEKYGLNKFILLYRERLWSDSENAWIGWERKRGKLECLNCLLAENTCPEVLIKVGSKESLSNIQYVITLDADTELPKDTAKKLIATITHPLNKPHLSEEGEIERGYTIIQPRISTNPFLARHSLFTYIFSEESNIDPYNQAVSNIYQDLALGGIYQGKCIYDVKAFNARLKNRFPHSHILSHDLIEGAFVKTAYANDISFMDAFPSTYLIWSKRQHRWMRGDWQIIDWLFSMVPHSTNKKIPNSLNTIDKWKIFDNMRRALIPVCSFGLLIIGWFYTDQPLVWTALIALLYFLPTILDVISKVINFQLKEFPKSVFRSLINIALLPYQAYLSLDALFRVIYRRMISRHYLLEWDTSKNGKIPHAQFIYKLSLVSLMSVGVLSALWNTHAFNAASTFLLLWLISPAIVSILDRTILTRPSEGLSDEDLLFIRNVARRTWRYFDDFVNSESNWLPPDNYQEALNIEVAQRTSPTNIGLWMLCAMAAEDLKYITIDDLLNRIWATFDSINKLEVYEGHLLNWYETQKLMPLYPRYVSTVDSGNFLGSLWTLEQGMDQMMSAPLLSNLIFEGMQDTLSLIRESEELQPLKSALNSNPKNLQGIIHAIRKVSALAVKIPHTEDKENNYWIKKIQKQIEEYESVINRYFLWVEILDSISDPHLSIECNKAFEAQFSLRDFASQNLPNELMHVLNELEKAHSPAFQPFSEAVHKAQWLSGEKYIQAQQIVKSLQKISNSMNMSFLFNKDRKLFSIGYRVDDRMLDNSYYDLLASEARIASLVAIAKNDVPIEHWWALGRPYNYVYGQKVLMSWGGTMFEYLMPLLFNSPNPDSLLGQGCKSAVLCQAAYAARRGIPWGISEAAFSEIDVRKTYQYRSFGIPGLGFKRDLEDDLVVSPYSTALALAVDPKMAISNLKNMAKGDQGLLGAYGFYESIDFTRQHAPQGHRGVIVYAYMAHHQGMSLLAIANMLQNFTFPKRFHADPRIAGVESLLCERVPQKPPLGIETRKEVPISRLSQISPQPIMGIMETPHSGMPKVNLLSNGSFSIMVTNSGGSYTRWNEVDITRWYSDSTCDSWGTFCYIKDLNTGQVWSTTYQPTNTKGRKYQVSFKADKVEVNRRDNDIETITNIVVSPEDNAEIRYITLANLSRDKQKLELTSYSELALAPHMTDRAHPAFNKMFIETEFMPEHSALLAFRRLRSPEDKQILAAHILASDLAIDEAIQFETERPRFIGRGKSLKKPLALEGDLSNNYGFVLDPIFSLRCRITLEPGQRAHLAFVTAAADTHDRIEVLIRKYVDISASQRAIDMAWTHAQLELRHLRIHQEEAQLFQKLASRILYPHGQLRPTTEHLKKNRAGQSNLWSYGISGDLPIVIVSVENFHDVDLVKQVLTAHVFWRLRGLKVDLIILNEEATGYDQPLYNQLQRIIHSHSSHTEVGVPGGVFLINADQIPEKDLNLFLSISRANLIAARGSLRQQLVSPPEGIRYSSRIHANKKFKEEPSPPLPFAELALFNGYGGFTQDGREYVIYLGPNAATPAPWINVMANSQFGCIVTDSGPGAAWFGNSQNNRITPWSNDSTLNPISDCIYIRDEDLATSWTPTPEPIRELDPYRVIHGQGYTRFEHNSHNIEQRLLIFVPIDDDGKPISARIQKLTLTNRSANRRHLSIFSYCDLVLGENREDSQLHIITGWDAESQALFAYNRYHPSFGCCVAFAGANPIPHSYTGNRTEFIGRNNSPSEPASLKRKALSGETGGALDPCAALQVKINLEPGETKNIVFILGYAQDDPFARNMLMNFRQEGWIESAYEKMVKFWDKTLGTIQVKTPDQGVNSIFNRWLLYQVLSCRFWGRTAFYQSSGAYGFRDQLQDAASLIYSHPELTREHILKAASRQFLEGDVQHWWHDSGAGVRTLISDDLLWLPYITAQYVRTTNDISILSEEVAFLKGELLKPGEHEVYFTPEITEEKASLLEHCRRAIHKGLTEGPHGLPLIGSGDWNDGMNRVGIEGKGESVWLAWFLIQVMNDFAEMLVLSEQLETAEGYRKQAERLAKVVEESAWDGNWYRRAYFDNGTPLGSASNDEDIIDSLPQSWGIISGAADPKRANVAMESVEKHLVLTKEQIVLLLTPSFNKTPLDPGYIKGYPPGVRENGGQYTHGSLWTAMAFALKGEGSKAVELLKMMHPIAHTKDIAAVHHYKVEPYIVAADVYSLSSQMGRGGWTWYTGAAGWMYRIWLENVLGFKLRGDRFIIDPIIPESWDGFKMHYMHVDTLYEIVVENPEHLKQRKLNVELDGVLQKRNEIMLTNDAKQHTVKVRFLAL